MRLSIIIILMCIFFHWNCTTSEESVHQNAPIIISFDQLTDVEQRAVKTAESFISEQGYTDSISSDTSKLVFELFDLLEKSRSEILKSRHHELKSEAYGIGKGRKGGKPGWTVLFEYTSGNFAIPEAARKNDPSGRAVTMDLDYSNLKVEHVDFILQFAQKKLIHNHADH